VFAVSKLPRGRPVNTQPFKIAEKRNFLYRHSTEWDTDLLFKKPWTQVA